MKIGLCGTMSVGKTTLVKALMELDKFKNYTGCVERSKYLSELGIPLNTDSTINGQFINNTGVASYFYTTLNVTGFLNVNNAAQSVAGLNTTRLNAAIECSIGFAGYPDSSAVAEIKSTTRGFLPPRMTQAQILAIASPAVGLMAYNTDLDCPVFYSAAGWRKISHSAM